RSRWRRSSLPTARRHVRSGANRHRPRRRAWPRRHWATSCCRWPVSPAAKTPTARCRSLPRPGSPVPASATSSAAVAPCGGCASTRAITPMPRKSRSASPAWASGVRRSSPT
ncbi:hypothetical protein XPR_4019, partial [Xanthomonas arboricola pv. pruni MAFF 301420]